MQPKSVLKNRKSEFDACLEDDTHNHHHMHEDTSLSTSETEVINVSVYLTSSNTKKILIEQLS